MSTTWTFQPEQDGPKLHAVTYESSAPKAVLVFHHGIKEHSGRYHNSALLHGHVSAAGWLYYNMSVCFVYW